MLPVAIMTRSFSSGNAVRYVVSGFVDDVKFSLNVVNEPESKMTHIFRPVQCVTAPGAKSAVSDCVLF